MCAKKRTSSKSKREMCENLNTSEKCDEVTVIGGAVEPEKNVASEAKDIIAIEKEEHQRLVQDIESKVPQAFNESQRNLLLNETPRYKIKRRMGKGGENFDYVDIGYVLEQLNILTGHRWDWSIDWQTSLEEANVVGQFIVRGTLTLKSKDGEEIKKTNFGKSDIKYKKTGGYLDFGNDMKGAVSDCVKKCASMFGIALDVYSGAVKRRQDSEHPEALITEGQRKRLEALAQEANIGHSGLKQIINKRFDYTSTKDVQRRHFEDIVQELESLASEVAEEVMPEDIKEGFEKLGTPNGKRIATYRSYNKMNKLDELREKIKIKIGEREKFNEPI